MKKYGFYLLAFVCSLNFFAACSDDDGDDNRPDPVWSDYVATFSTDNVLTINGNLNKEKDVQVVLAKGTNDNAKLTLKNIVIEDASLEIDGVEMKEQATGTYTFTATKPVAESEITVSGTLTPGTVTKATGPTPVELDLTVDRKVTSDLAGDWSLDMEEPFTFVPHLKEGVGQNIIYAWYGVQEFVDGFVNTALLAKVDDVKINFETNGTFDFSWLPAGEGKYKTIADIENPAIASLLGIMNFEYYTNDNDGIVYLGDQSLLGLIELSAGLLPSEYLPIIELAKNLFTTQGNYLILPLNVTKSEGGGKAFSLTLPAAALNEDILNILLPLIPQELLDQLLVQLGVTFPELIGALDSLTVQLNFQ